MLILTRDDVLPVLNELIVAPVTRTVRGLRTEVPLSPEDGMPTTCAINLDHISLAQRSQLGAAMCSLPAERWDEVKAALLIACGFSAKEDKPAV